jgi:plastocyanin
LISPRFIRAGALGALVLLLASCAGSTGTPVPVPSGAVVLRVSNNTFVPADISAPGANGFQLYFDNADTLPHDVVFVAPDGSRAFQSDTFTGVQQRLYNIHALAPGTYKLICDIHPEMHGTLTVP